MHTKKILFVTALSSLLVVSAACGRRDDGRVTDTAAGSVDIGSNMDVRVADVELGRAVGADKRIVLATDNFAPTDTIYASVRTSGTGTGATLTARWMFEDSVAVQEQNATVTPVSNDTYTEFHITKATPWPKGKYKLVVLLNGKETESESFTVR